MERRILLFLILTNLSTSCTNRVIHHKEVDIPQEKKLQDASYEELISKLEQPPVVTMCGAPPRTVGNSTCKVSKGTNDYTLLQGNILKPFEELTGGEVLINPEGVIICADCSCAASDGYENATRISCPQGVISPGLINSHDHLGYNHNYPSSWGDYRFDRRNQWRKDEEKRVKYTKDSDYTAVIWTELRQVIAGTTAIASNNPAKGFLRNLEYTGKYEESSSRDRVDYNVFPLRDINGDAPMYKTCEYPNIVNPDHLDDIDCFLPHVAEGVDQNAWNEFYCLSGRGPSPGVNMTSPKSSFIHMLPLYPDDAEILSRQEMSVVWSPRSNIALYGNTAPIPLYRNMHINIALSSDWTPSGSTDLLRELKCADTINTKYFNKTLSDRYLWLAVTLRAALAVHAYKKLNLGYLDKGGLADITIFDGSETSSFYQTVIDADPTKVLLVMRGGKLLYGDADILNEFNETGCDNFSICGSKKFVCAQQETGYTFQQLQNKNKMYYPLFFCSEDATKYVTPDNEPACKPARRNRSNVLDKELCGLYPRKMRKKDGDGDGDGISDERDNCPNIFNPVRPVDYFTSHGCFQADFDNDGKGDVCDASPLNPEI
ncbi:MAG: hypothetical protein D3924_03315 [Candidatus Electrothrix sp. AR4]|nr:hypothetical protein [Candidatus Electrothrix sp. AR4]